MPKIQNAQGKCCCVAGRLFFLLPWNFCNEIMKFEAKTEPARDPACQRALWRHRHENCQASLQTPGLTDWLTDFVSLSLVFAALLSATLSLLVISLTAKLLLKQYRWLASKPCQSFLKLSLGWSWNLQLQCSTKVVTNSYRLNNKSSDVTMVHGWWPMVWLTVTVISDCYNYTFTVAATVS